MHYDEVSIEIRKKKKRWSDYCVFTNNICCTYMILQMNKEMWYDNLTKAEIRKRMVDESWLIKGTKRYYK